MIVCGHQPNYLPYGGFFHKMAECDLFVIVDNVQFVKRGPFGWIHRNRIRTSGGWDWLTVPVLTKGKFTQRIMDVQIDNQLPWERKHWRSIEWNYRNAPYFGEYRARFEPVYHERWSSLNELNIMLIEILRDILGIKVPIKRAGELGIQGEATGLVVDICRKTGANAYLSGIHGRDYLDESALAKEGFSLVYQEFQHPVYPQCAGEDFISNLSMIDLIFNCGARSLDILMARQTV